MMSSKTTDELIKRLSTKRPKSIQSLREYLTDFGLKVITIEPIIKRLPALLEDRNKNVRKEAKLLTVEVYKLIGPALKSQLVNLEPAVIAELEGEFVKLGNLVGTKLSQEKSQNEADTEVAPLQPVNILTHLPKDFYEKCVAKKWQERKDAIDAVVLLISNRKLATGDYADLVRALKKIISKDTNAMIVAVAGKCLAGLANGLKIKFKPYIGQCFPAVLEKFREKNQNVVQAMRGAVDAMFPCTTLDSIQEDLRTFLGNKNPSVKAETAGFMARAFSKCDATVLTKMHLKIFCPGLLKALNDRDPIVRECAAAALGTAMKILGESVMLTYIKNVANLKMAKIKKFFENDVVVVPKERKKPVALKPKLKSSAGLEIVPGKNTVKFIEKPADASEIGADASSRSTSEAPVEKELSQEEVDAKLAQVVSPAIFSGLSDGKWKTRLSSVDQLMQLVRNNKPDACLTQALVRLLVAKPGLKETSYRVLNRKLEVIAYLASNAEFTKRSALFVIDDLTKIIGDVKSGNGAKDALTAIAKTTNFDFIATQALDCVFSRKNQENQVQVMNWVTSYIKDFDLIIQVNPVIDKVEKALTARNKSVRTSAMTLMEIMEIKFTCSF